MTQTYLLHVVLDLSALHELLRHFVHDIGHDATADERDISHALLRSIERNFNATQFAQRLLRQALSDMVLVS